MPSSTLLTEKACTAAEAAHIAREYMHVNSSSIGRRPQFGSVTRSSILDSCVEDGFFLFFGVWIRRIGPIFPLPKLTPDKYAYDA